MSAVMQPLYVVGIEIMVFWTSLWPFNSGDKGIFFFI